MGSSRVRLPRHAGGPLYANQTKRQSLTLAICHFLCRPRALGTGRLPHSSPPETAGKLFCLCMLLLHLDYVARLLLLMLLPRTTLNVGPSFRMVIPPRNQTSDSHGKESGIRVGLRAPS